MPVKRKHVFVAWFGMLWRMTERNYKRLIKRIAADEPWGLNDFGTYVGDLEFDVTDATAEDAQDKLDEMETRT